MRKINNFKNYALKTECIEKKFEFCIFLEDVENAKNNTNTSRTYFFIFCILKIFRKKRVKFWVTIARMK